MTRQGVDAALSGTMFSYAAPLVGVVRPYSVLGQSARVSGFLVGAGGSVGGDFLYGPVKTFMR